MIIIVNGQKADFEPDVPSISYEDVLWIAGRQRDSQSFHGATVTYDLRRLGTRARETGILRPGESVLLGAEMRFNCAVTGDA